MNKRKSLLIGGGIAVAVIAVGGGATAWALSKSMTPEKLLYSALQQDRSGDTYSNETLLNGDGTTDLKSQVVVKDNWDQLKAEGDLTCSVENEATGSVRMDAKLIQINEKTYIQYGETKIGGTGDAEYEAAVNESINATLAGKAIALSDPDPTFAGYKEKGVAFAILGAESQKHSPKQIADKLKQYNVVTINGSSEKKLGDTTTVEYDLSVRRAAYEKFMDDVAPGFPYRTDVLNTLFDNDSEEVVLVVNKDTKEVISETYSMANPCIDMLSSLDPAAAEALPEVIRIKNTTVKKNDANKITTPANAMSEEDFAAMMAATEE
jgi:hypothetical protein